MTRLLKHMKSGCRPAPSISAYTSRALSRRPPLSQAEITACSTHGWAKSATMVGCYTILLRAALTYSDALCYRRWSILISRNVSDWRFRTRGRPRADSFLCLKVHIQRPDERLQPEGILRWTFFTRHFRFLLQVKQRSDTLALGTRGRRQRTQIAHDSDLEKWL